MRRPAIDHARQRCWGSACGRCATKSATTDCPQKGVTCMLNDPSIDALSRFLDVSVFRSGLILSNMANVDTPGYRTRDVNFSQELERAASSPKEDVFSPV